MKRSVLQMLRKIEVSKSHNIKFSFNMKYFNYNYFNMTITA